MNYFELFDLPFKPVVDKTFVSKKFFALQKKYHPDFYTQASEDEKDAMMQRSADVNKAYKIFQHPHKTLEYFLEQKAVVTTDEKYALAPEFLMEMMDLNEALTEEDAPTIRTKVVALENELEAGVAATLGTFGEAGISNEQLQSLKEYYYRKKYVKRILDRLGD